MVLFLSLGAATTAFLVGKEFALFGSGLSFLSDPNFENSIGGINSPEQPGIPTPELENRENLLNLTTLTPWDGAGRVTVLLLGLDFRDWEAGEKYSRSDTMILLTLDPLTRTAGILSIPRDMWVAIPGFKHGKINTAYYLGEAYKLPGGGPAMAVKTVESFLGVPINYYAQIDFDAFVRFIDEIGGVKIDVPEKITIDLLGAGSKTKKKLQPGIQVLPGQYALAYARARYTEGGDFDRARRQQQVIMGIRNRILEFDLLPNLIGNAPKLYQELSSGIRTNLSLDEIIQLALLAKSVPQEEIKQGVLDKNYVLFAESPDKLSILIPLPDKIHTLRDEIFAASGAMGPNTPGQSNEQMKAEAPRLSLFDGVGNGELSNRTIDWLNSQGAAAVNSGSADQAYLYTTVTDFTGNPFTVKYLVETMGINPNRILWEFDPNAPVDVEIILGSDWERNNPLQ
jgi:LCP family protein required for cell wall assembly